MVQRPAGLALVGASLLACTSAPPTPVEQLVSAMALSESLPRIVERPINVALDDQPETGRYLLAVSPDGWIAYPASRNAGPFMRILDTTGARLAAFGDRGEGPGEFINPSSAYWSGDTLLILNRTGVFAAFTRTGAFLEEYLPPNATLSLGVVNWGLIQASPQQTPGEISRVPLTKGGVLRQESQVFAPSESLVIRGLTTSALGIAIPFGTSDDRVAIGDGMAYETDVYDHEEHLLYRIRRDVPPRLRGPRELASAEKALRAQQSFRGPNGEPIPADLMAERLKAFRTQPVPHFGRSALHFDGKNRLWVLGGAGDSSFADVFAEDRFLGRLLLPCYSPSDQRAVAGSWLVLSCQDDSGENALRIYRIDPD